MGLSNSGIKGSVTEDLKGRSLMLPVEITSFWAAETSCFCCIGSRGAPCGGKGWFVCCVWLGLLRSVQSMAHLTKRNLAIMGFFLLFYFF